MFFELHFQSSDICQVRHKSGCFFQHRIQIDCHLKRKLNTSLNLIQSKDNNGVKGMPKKAKEKQWKGKVECKKVSKRLLLVASTPEPSPSELDSVGDTSSYYASEEGSRVSDASTSKMKAWQ